MDECGNQEKGPERIWLNPGGFGGFRGAKIFLIS
jgi:hypothetical protein